MVIEASKRIEEIDFEKEAISDSLAKIKSLKVLDRLTDQEHARAASPARPLVAARTAAH